MLNSSNSLKENDNLYTITKTLSIRSIINDNLKKFSNRVIYIDCEGFIYGRLLTTLSIVSDIARKIELMNIDKILYRGNPLTYKKEIITRANSGSKKYGPFIPLNDYNRYLHRSTRGMINYKSKLGAYNLSKINFKDPKSTNILQIINPNNIIVLKTRAPESRFKIHLLKEIYKSLKQ